MLTVRAAVAGAVALAIGAAAYAQSSDRLARGDLQWREIVPGVSFAAAYGDWEKEGHGKFVRIAREAQIPVHVHTNGYHAVIVSGRMRNILDAGTHVELAPGDYFYMASQRPHAHECLTDEPCLFYTYSDGSWDIEPVEAPATQ